MAGVESNLTGTKLAENAAQNDPGAANDPTVRPDSLDGNIPTTVIGTMIIEELITTFAVENGTDDLGTDEMDVIDQASWKTALVAAVLSLIIILTIGGNVLVVLSPIVSKRLRTVTYTFLVSLASADLLLGITVLPWSAIYTISAEWPFSVIFCNIYVSCDVMFCTSSILHLLVISLERYFAITRPYAYQRKMNHKKAWIAIVVVWVVSVGVSFLPLHLGWNTADGSVQNYDHPSQCVLTWNMAYALFDGILLFYFPLVLMLFVYARIVIIAYHQAKSIKSMMVVPAPSITRGTNAQEKHENANNNHKGVVDEHKAVKIIAVVMGSFVVCWVPYFTMFTFGPLFKWNISDLFYLIVLWLGYFNSLINPLVYACMNREFRRAFKTILSCARWNRKCIGSFGSHDSQIKQTNFNQTNTRYNGSVVTYATKDTLSTDTQCSVESKRHSDLYLKLVKTQEDIAEDSEENRQSESQSDQNNEKQLNGPQVLDVEIGNHQYDYQESSITNNAELENNDHLKEREPSSEQPSEEPEPLEELFITESTDFKQPEAQLELNVINRQGGDPATNGTEGEDPIVNGEGEDTVTESEQELTPLQITTKADEIIDRDSPSEKVKIIDEDQHLLQDEEELSSETIEIETNDIKLKTLQSPTQNREIIVDVP